MIGKTWRSVSWVKYVCQKNRRIQKPTEACLNLRQRMCLSLNLHVSLFESCITRIPERSERPHSYLVHHLLHILLSFFRGWFNVKLAVFHACASVSCFSSIIGVSPQSGTDMDPRWRPFNTRSVGLGAHQWIFWCILILIHFNFFSLTICILHLFGLYFSALWLCCSWWLWGSPSNPWSY